MSAAFSTYIRPRFSFATESLNGKAMASNAGAVHGNIETHVSTRDREMRAYDRLAPRLREFIGQMPLCFSAEATLEMQTFYGVERTLQMGHEMLAKEFPNWRPI
jgi:hypothetical protein